MIDTQRKICKIAVKAFLNDSFLGLRLIDQKGQYIIDETWSKWSHSEWVEFEVPDGMEVIGLKTRHSNYEMIQRIGFILWRPPVTAVDKNLSERQEEEEFDDDLAVAAAEESITKPYDGVIYHQDPDQNYYYRLNRASMEDVLTGHEERKEPIIIQGDIPVTVHPNHQVVEPQIEPVVSPRSVSSVPTSPYKVSKIQTAEKA